MTHHNRQLVEALRLAIFPASQMAQAVSDVASTLLEALPAMLSGVEGRGVVTRGWRGGIQEVNPTNHAVQLLCPVAAW